MKRHARLRPRSAKKAAWCRLYGRELRRRRQEQEASHGSTFCQRCRCPGPVDGHHPAGQIGALIMLFFLLCRECHDWCHFEAPREARREGWLQ